MLRARLFLSLLPLVVIVLAAGFYGIALISRLADKAEAAVDANYRRISAILEMEQTLAGMQRELAAKNAAGASFADLKRRFEDSLSEEFATPAGQREKALTAQLATNYLAFQQAVYRVNLPHPPKDSPDKYLQAAGMKAAQMGELLQKIRNLNYQSSLDSSQALQKSTRHVTDLMVAGFVAVLLVSILTCYLVSRSILRPIQLLTKATRELGEGDLSQPVPSTGRDELAQLAGAFNKMAAQLAEFRRNTSSEILRLHKTTETTLASFPDPIFVLSSDARIESQNPAGDELKSALQLGDRLPEPLQAIATGVLQTGKNFLPHSYDEVVCHRIHGSEKYFLPRVLAMRDRENRIFGVAVVLYDVTRFRLLDGAKTNLVGTVSHELKSPLTSVRMALHILLEKTVGELTPEQEELVRAARDDSERLLRILNDLLDLARLDERGAELRKEKVAPAELLQKAIADHAENISVRGLKVACVIEPGLPEVLADRQRIGHVFDNLLSNAVKHSPPGGEIRLSANRIDGGAVQFSIADQGTGIPAEFQLRIFDRFFRVPGQEHNGAGLGLSIAKEITQAHGGHIGVASQPGQGSTFFVQLKASG